jgi:nicotinic acid mononucleotide adenylyltransferase
VFENPAAKQKARAEEKAQLEAEQKARERAQAAQAAAEQAQRRAKRPGKKVVVAFGRFNPPHRGHALVVDTVERLARSTGADAVIFPSWSQDPKKNPLPYAEKAGFLRQLFPRMNFAVNPQVRSLGSMLDALADLGYSDVSVVVGADQTQDFQRIRSYALKRLKRYDVAELPRAKTSWSATKMRAAAADDDYATFRDALPTKNATLAKNIYTSVKRYMGKTTKVQESKLAFLVYGTSPDDAAPLLEAFRGLDYNVTNMTGRSFGDVCLRHRLLESQGYQVRLYVRSRHARTRPLSESLNNLSILGGLRKELARDLVEVVHKDDAEAAFDVRVHARKLNEALSVEPPKEPTEVDRLKVQQKQQLVATKQRQNDELFQAQERELQKKTREDAEKIATGERKREITR